MAMTTDNIPIKDEEQPFPPPSTTEPDLEVAGVPKKDCGCGCGGNHEGDCKKKRRKMIMILLAAGAAIGLALYFTFRKKQ